MSHLRAQGELICFSPFPACLFASATRYRPESARKQCSGAERQHAGPRSVSEVQHAARVLSPLKRFHVAFCDEEKICSCCVSSRRRRPRPTSRRQGGGALNGRQLRQPAPSPRGSRGMPESGRGAQPAEANEVAYESPGSRAIPQRPPTSEPSIDSGLARIAVANTAPSSGWSHRSTVPLHKG